MDETPMTFDPAEYSLFVNNKEVVGAPPPFPPPTLPSATPWGIVVGKGVEFSNKPRGRIAIYSPDVAPAKGYRVIALTVDDSDESIANAKLMAAAPKLLFALQAVLRNRYAGDGFEEARAAIEEAMG